MKSGCEENEVKAARSIELPVLASAPVKQVPAESRTSRWRAAALITLNLLMIAHIVQWKITGSTISPIEPSETMFTLQQGAVNAGFIFFTLAILATLIFGRFVCGWGCHIVALQDLCAWLLKKMGLTPRPFRSRLLIYVPLLAALYMFVWPTVIRFFAKPPEEPLFPQFTNHLVTTEFWATFPTVAVAIPFLFICGFMTVYFLGQKGFCTYGCPYGGFFGVADKIAPGKIRVTDACNECGHCTATCTSNVLVHAEVKQYGMVVDPGCMKCMDCISVCPNDALYFGFGKPAVGASAPAIKKNYSLSWPEEIAAALVFFLSLMAVWNVYQLVPMLMALGIAAVTTFVAMRMWKLLRSKDLAFYGVSLRSAGRFKSAGWIFVGFAVIWLGLVAHSGVVRYFERAGTIAFESLQIPDELALAGSDPREWLGASDQLNVANGREQLATARRLGLFVNTDALPKLAWLEYLSGNHERAIELLGVASERQQGQSRAISFYYRGAILSRLGRHKEALANLDRALIERPDMTSAREEKGEVLWKLGSREQAVTVWNEALRANAGLPLTYNFIAGAARQMGREDAAAGYLERAEQYTPNDPHFHWVLGERLRGVGMTELADQHFSRAAELDPTFRSRLGSQ